MPKRPEESEPQIREVDRAENDVRAVFIDTVEDASALHENLLKVKEALDNLIIIELDKNKELRKHQIQQAMLALAGSNDLPVADNLDWINKKNSENLEKIRKLRAKLALIHGNDYGSSLQRKALETRIAIAVLDNSIAEKMQQTLLSTTMLTGEMNNLASSKLIQASRFIELKLKEVQELNLNLKHDLKSQVGIEPPPEPSRKRQRRS